MTKYVSPLVIIAIVLLGCLFIPSNVRACESPQTAIFFVNGIGNTYEQAEESRFWLEGRVLSRGVDPSCVSFDIAYNHNEPLFLDWVEAWQQKMAEVDDFMVTFWLFLGRVASGSGVFLATVYNALTRIDPPVYLIDADLDEHLAAYRAEINAGRTVISVPHSQGNFYANQAWEKLTDEERTSFHLVAAATPSITVADGGPYTTLDEDKLIAAVPLSLPSNLTNGPDFSCVDDWKCHGFKETYLASTTKSEDKIVEDILALLAAPEPPPPPEELAELRGTVTYQLQPEDPILPAAGASSTLYAVPWDAPTPVRQYATTTVDADGHYSYTRLPPGRYIFRLECEAIYISFHDAIGLVLDEARTYTHDAHWALPSGVNINAEHC